MLKNLWLEVTKIIHSDHPFVVMVHDILNFIAYVWNYRIFRTDANQFVAVSNIVIGICLLVMGFKFARRVSRIVKKRLINTIEIETNVASSFEKIIYYILLIIVIVFVLDVTDVPLTALTVFGTTLALGVGLGSQNIVNNFISGLIIMVECPIKVGDIIEIKNLDLVGRVEHIGARCVSLCTEDNINILIPNSSILQDTIINWTLEDPNFRATLEYFVAHGHDQDKIDEIIYKILEEENGIIKDPIPRVLIKGMNKDGITYEIDFWINLNQSIDRKYIYNSINRAVEKNFALNNIRFAEEEKCGYVKLKNKKRKN